MLFFILHYASPSILKISLPFSLLLSPDYDQSYLLHNSNDKPIIVRLVQKC